MCELTIVGAGAGFVVIDKPPGVRSVPGRGPDAAESIEQRVRARWTDYDGPVIVHRLDIETSGLMVVARDRVAHQRLSRQFMHRKVGKTYDAVLQGVVTPDEGAVDLPLRVDWENRPRQMVCHEKGRKSRTLYRVVARSDAWTRVAFRPMTGRTHQLRVHSVTPVSAGGLGAPILGDTLYGDASSASRLLLHADHLSFWAPYGPGWCKFDSPSSFGAGWA
ncbi:MAG: RNA pseudouridine synthase [Phycisphaerales bacterium]|nr:RNA pseudouridine synthase [Phycisphaerales bacterium]NNM25999.1 RNA pseudouridine synthase [Phycisphaerales bacterium]